MTIHPPIPIPIPNPFLGTPPPSYPNLSKPYKIPFPSPNYPTIYLLILPTYPSSPILHFASPRRVPSRPVPSRSMTITLIICFHSLSLPLSPPPFFFPYSITPRFLLLFLFLPN